MKQYFEILKKCSLFADISEDEIEKLLGCLGAKVVSFDKKYTVIAEGNPARYIGVVLSGSVQIIRVDYFGNRSLISEAEEAEIFGESFACAEVDEIPITVIANEPSEIMLIDCSRITCSCSKACSFHQKLIYNLMKELALKNIMFHRKIEITSARSTREKLMTYLMFQAKKVGSSSFEIPFDRQELADYLEVDRSGLSAEISKLCRAGVLKSRKNRFELL